MLAVEYNSTSVHSLISAGIDVNVQNTNGTTALMVAALCNLAAI